jgi:hypothetical protein
MANSDDLTGPADGHDPGTARLLLALTSLYVQRPVHTAEEQQQYVELVRHLIDKVGPTTRAAVAVRLRRHPDAPVEMIERLGGMPCGDDDGPDGAPPPVAMDQVAMDQRAAGDPPPESDQRLAHANAECEPAPALSDTAPAAPQPEPPTPETGEAFFAASPEERRRLLSMLAARGDAAAAPESSRRFHVRIDTAAWRGRTDAFARDFERLIDAPKSLCERILNDPSGEPMVVAAKATGMPVAMLQRILLLVSPATNHSVQRVYELSELYQGLDGRTARDLLAAWRERAAGPSPQTALAVVTNPRVANLRARFGALNARLQQQAARSQAGTSRDDSQDDAAVTGSSPCEDC